MGNGKRWMVFLLLAALLGLAASGCSSGPSAEELARQEAQEREEAARAQREAEARKLAEERRQQQEVMETFGPVGDPPPFALPPEERPQETAAAPAGDGGTQGAAAAPAAAAVTAPVAAGAEATLSIPPGTTPGTVRIDLSNTGPTITGIIPFEAAVPPLPEDPRVRVAIFSAPGQWQKARDTAATLGTHAREPLEERMGRRVTIAYMAESANPPRYQSEVHYRAPEFLHAAQSVAAVLPAQQWVGPMTPDERRQEGVDLVIYLGPDYR